MNDQWSSGTRTNTLCYSQATGPVENEERCKGTGVVAVVVVVVVVSAM